MEIENHLSIGRLSRIALIEWKPIPLEKYVDSWYLFEREYG